MAYKSHPLRGMLIPDTRCSPGNARSADESGDEQMPRAGGIAEPDSATSRLVVEATGDQDTDLVAQVEQGGHPQLGAGVRVSYRTTAEAATARRGWNAPNLVTGWTSASYGTTANTMLCALGMANGQILVAYRAAAVTSYLQTYTPDSDTWSGTIAFPDDVHATGSIALAQLPEGNVVAMYRDDGGQWRIKRYSVADAVSGGSWVTHALDPFSSSVIPGTAGTRSRLLILPTGEWAYFYLYSGNLWQFASSSHGAQFTRVLAATPDASSMADAVVTASGKIVVITSVSNALVAYTISSPWTPYNTVTSVQITTGGPIEDCWLAADPNGRVYAYERTGTDEIDMWYSDDDGASWTNAEGLYKNGDTDPYWTAGQIVHGGGAMWLAHQFVSGANTNDGSICLAKLGGYSSITLGGLGLPEDEFRYSPGGDQYTGALYTPIDLPANMVKWNTVAGAGTPSLASGRLQIATAANSYYFESPAPGTDDAYVAQFRAICTTGGSTTAQNAGVTIRCGSAATDYAVGIYLTTTSFVVYDVIAGSALATISVDMTAELDIFVYFIPNAHLFVAYKRPSVSTWTEAHDGGATSGVGTTGRYVRWGTANISTTTHAFRYIWTIRVTDNDAIIYAAASGATYSNIIGRLLTSYPAPIDKRSAYGRRQTYLRGKDGPGRVTDTFQARIRPDFPRESIYWQIAPSPRTTWRTVDDGGDAMSAGWELAGGASSSMGSSCIALCVLNTNAKTHYLYGDPNDGGGYDLLGTMTLSTGFASLTYTRTGNVIRINGGTVGSRYVWRGEFIGATIELDTAVQRRIGRHTEGVWNTTGRQVEIVLATEGDGAYDGTEPASGTCSIVAKSGVLVIPNINTATYRYLRYVCPQQECAGDYMEVGTVLVGAVQVIGQQWDWGWSIDHAVPTQESEARPGASRRTAIGPMAREWTVAWTEGVDIMRLRDTASPDHLSDDSGDTTGFATFGDVPFLLSGLLSETRGGEVPVVLLPKIPTSATTITDPTLFMYGRIVSSIRAENVLGDEGESELYRVNNVTVREIV